MPPRLRPSNDADPMTTREMFGLSLALPEPEAVAATCARHPMSIAFDVAAERLAAGDFAGHDAAMRIFRKLERRP